MIKLYCATCPRCGSTAAGPEQPDHCQYCPLPVDHTEVRRRLMRWLVACVLLGGLAGLLH